MSRTTRAVASTARRIINIIIGVIRHLVRVESRSFEPVMLFQYPFGSFNRRNRNDYSSAPRGKITKNLALTLVLDPLGHELALPECLEVPSLWARQNHLSD